MKKIRVNANWDYPKNILERLIAQFKTPDIDLSNIEFVFDNSYDYCVCFNHLSVEILLEKKYYCYPHEPAWSGSHQKYFPSNATVFGFDEKLYSGNCIETLTHAFYGGRGPWIDKLDVWNYDYLTSTNFEKPKNISCSISLLNGEFGIYKKRYNLLTKLLDLPYIDFYGCPSFNLPNTLPEPLKINFVRPYKFSITIENDFCKNWVTEKFYDAILTDCIPIYYGCSNIKDIYPEDGYILLDNIDDIDYVKSVINDINNNAEEIYNKKLPHLKKIKERYFKEYNLLNKIISL